MPPIHNPLNRDGSLQAMDYPVVSWDKHCLVREDTGNLIVFKESLEHTAQQKGSTNRQREILDEINQINDSVAVKSSLFPDSQAK